MSKSRMPLFLGLTAAGAGGYYLYRSGGDVKGAKQEMKSMSPAVIQSLLNSRLLTSIAYS